MSFADIWLAYSVAGFVLYAAVYFRRRGDKIHQVDSVAAFLWLVWPVFFLLLATVLLMKRYRWHIDVDTPQQGLSKWGIRGSELHTKACAIRCPWFELQIWNSKSGVKQ